MVFVSALLLSHHQCVASSPTDIHPASVTPICDVMRTRSLKTLGIGGLFKPDQLVQVLEELPHCTHIRELELNFYLLELMLFLSDKVRHVPFLCNASTV